MPRADRVRRKAGELPEGNGDMSDDFAVLDFALVNAAPRAVALAAAAAPLPPAGRPAAPAPAGGGLLGRLFGRASSPAAPLPRPGPALLAQPPGTLPGGVLVREVFEDLGFGGQDRELRLSAPVGLAGLTLVELRERVDGGPSPRLKALSAALPGAEILAFRLTGGRHPGAEHAFCVYRDGVVQRRIAKISRFGTGEDADWSETASGTPHGIEGDDPPRGMTPARQAALLERLGIDADHLLENRDGFSEVIELSTRPGGTPPRELHKEVPAPVAAPTADPPLDAAAWEEEVTQLLLAAVSDALPESEQVAWLDELTADLDAGELRAALARARDLLARGSRPAATREDAAARLATLFGVPG